MVLCGMDEWFYVGTLLSLLLAIPLILWASSLASSSPCLSLGRELDGQFLFFLTVHPTTLH